MQNDSIKNISPCWTGRFLHRETQSWKKYFSVVYDCGSKTKEIDLTQVIDRVFGKDEDIECLFISHFHEDHIGGIEYLNKRCNIKNVVLPLIVEDYKKLTEAFLRIDNNDVPTKFQLGIIYDPQKVFKGSRIIKIQETTEENNTNESFILNEKRDSDSNIPIELPSGSRLQIDKGNLDWVFIPYNYKQSENLDGFKKALKNVNPQIDLDNINAHDAAGVLKYKTELKKAYYRINGDLNLNSMIMLSTPFSTQTAELNRTRAISSMAFSHFYLGVLSARFCSYCFDCCIPVNLGCLYLGDIKLTKKVFQGIDLKIKPFLSDVGTIQIPHHGSRHNYNDSIHSWNIRMSIVSFGSKNTYGHPSIRVLEHMVCNGMHTFLVTEDFYSMIMQCCMV